MVAPETGSITYVNPAFLALAKETDDTVMKTPWAEKLQLPPKTSCPLCEGQAPKSNRTSSQEADFLTVHAALLRHPNGEAFRVKVKHSPLPNGTVLCLVDAFSEDITLTQAHSDFVSTVSHEFRTPLTSIKGFADTLLRYGTQLPGDQQKRFITIIKDQADRLTRLVENLLTVSKLGASRMEMSYRPVPLKRLVEKVIQNVLAKSGLDKSSQGQPGGGRALNLEISDSLPELWVDADKLEQILINLVDNAIKYSYPGTQVQVSACMAPDNPDRVQIRIQDEGVGIPAEHLPQIFTKFSRIDNPLTREVEGTGLGLYITQSLTKAMEGEISVESQEDQGTTFTLTFPVASAERQAAHRRKMSPAMPNEE
jgi:two-component system phosphate regulon sensor histidine kinase PhoR